MSESGPIDWSADQYHADRSCVSSTALKLFAEDVQLYGLWRKGEWERPVTEEMFIGTALHTLLLEPDLLHITWRGQCEATFGSGTRKGQRCTSSAVTGDTKCGRHGGVEQLPPGKIVLTEDQGELLQSMAAQVRKHPFAQPFLDHTRKEQTFRWYDEETGLWLKCRSDMVTRPHVADLKAFNPTVMGPPLSDRKLESTIYQRGLHKQAAFYCRVLRGLGIVVEQVRFHFIFCSNKGPCPYVKVRELESSALRLGERQIVADLTRLQIRLARDDWEQEELADTHERTVGVPAWAYEE